MKTPEVLRRAAALILAVVMAAPIAPVRASDPGVGDWPRAHV